MLVGAEVFVPGGVMGTIGGLCLVAAVGVSFKVFGPQIGSLIAFATVILMGIVMYLWIRIFPKTKMGRKMTVSHSEADYRAPDGSLAGLMGRTGVAVTPLRPGGFALIDGRRVDVISDVGMLESGAEVRVVRVDGFRVLVKPVVQAEQGKG
jgi:membrane-bound serine protease (ClpP class)